MFAMTLLLSFLTMHSSPSSEAGSDALHLAAQSGRDGFVAPRRPEGRPARCVPQEGFLPGNLVIIIGRREIAVLTGIKTALRSAIGDVSPRPAVQR
ncbi:MAG: hypothetical protein HYU75_26585 [Betaproteobacteria bacterium]|nr:hypothetical protein [Betaproteobacteria bacterium]